MPKVASKKSNPAALALYDERLAQLAKTAVKTASQVGGGGNFISFKSGQMSYQKKPIVGNKMNSIILHAVLENQWYAEGFSDDNPTSPACYAFGLEAKDMAPNPAHVEKPVSVTCNGCPNAQFGTADKGKGKACANCHRVALVTQDDLDNIETAEVAFAKLSYFSSLEYDAYVKELEALYHKPPFAFITEISVVPDPKSQFRVKFRMVEQVKDMDNAAEVFEALFKRYEEVAATIDFPYPKYEANAKPAKANGNGKVAVRKGKSKF